MNLLPYNVIGKWYSIKVYMVKSDLFSLSVQLQAYVVRQKTALFKRIHQGWRLRNHVITTKHGLSLVGCGAECNMRDDCVSFNISNGVCELNNQVVGGTGFSRADFVKDVGFNYYEEQ